MKKISFITIAIILVVVILAIFILNRPHPETTEELAKCIGSHSTVYVQLGCHACESQEELFGDNYQYINSVDCFYDQAKCQQQNITATPTWIIKGKEYLGVQSIETLKDLTGC